MRSRSLKAQRRNIQEFVGVTTGELFATLDLSGLRPSWPFPGKVNRPEAAIRSDSPFAALRRSTDGRPSIRLRATGYVQTWFGAANESRNPRAVIQSRCRTHRWRMVPTADIRIVGNNDVRQTLLDIQHGNLGKGERPKRRPRLRLYFWPGSVIGQHLPR